MIVDQEVIKFFKEKKIDYFVLSTDKAVEIFNKLNSEKKAAILHLTC